LRLLAVFIKACRSGNVRTLLLGSRQMEKARSVGFKHSGWGVHVLSFQRHWVLRRGVEAVGDGAELLKSADSDMDATRAGDLERESSTTPPCP
jgi:hypothetical protein